MRLKIRWAFIDLNHCVNDANRAGKRSKLPNFTSIQLLIYKSFEIQQLAFIVCIERRLKSTDRYPFYARQRGIFSAHCVRHGDDENESDRHPDQKSEINTNELCKYLCTPERIVCGVQSAYLLWNKFLLVQLAVYLLSVLRSLHYCVVRAVRRRFIHNHKRRLHKQEHAHWTHRRQTNWISISRDTR